MAERRMFTKKITDSDSFIELSSSAQALYFHLNQGADDDGFNNQVQNAMFKSHATIDDLKVLMMKNFIIRFESGVIVIKHWRLHNTLRKDRYTPTNFQEEFKLLGIKDNGSYTLNDNGCQLVANWLPQYSIDKNSIDKNSIDKNILSSKIDNNEDEELQDFVEEVISYLNFKLGTRFSPTTKSTISNIKARLKEGKKRAKEHPELGEYTIEDFKIVIDKKYLDWYGTDMQKHLNPDTLFGNKFEKYLNQQDKVTFQDALNERQGYQNLLEKGLI